MLKHNSLKLNQLQNYTDTTPSPPPLNCHDWSKLYTAESKPRGYIEMGQLTDLWLHMGTLCNLNCPSCFEGAGKNSKRIENLSFAEAKTIILQSIEMNVQRFCFTGGEPFIHKDFIKILDFALDHGPCLVLTNATAPIEKYFFELQDLKSKPHRLYIRVSLDYPLEQKHDLERGQGSFRRTLQNCATISKFGHTLSIARRKDNDEDEIAVTQQYINIFKKFGLPVHTNIVAFPDLLLSSQSKNPEITEDCMIKYKTKLERDNFMCCHSMMATKKNGQLCFYPCTLVDDDDSFILGHTLSQACSKEKVILRHQRCFACFAHGTSCSETCIKENKQA